MVIRMVLLVQFIILLLDHTYGLATFLPPVGPKVVEFEKERVRFKPKMIKKMRNEFPKVIAPKLDGPPKINALPQQDKKMAKNNIVSHRLESDDLYSTESTYVTSSTKIHRERDKNDLAKKVESTLLYKPKYPAYPDFKMCRLQDFDVSKATKLGKGGFGNVFLGRHRESGVPVAIKLISHTSIQKSTKHVEFEETIHARLYHPWIAKFFCTMADPESSDIYFVLEYVKGYNLAKKIAMTHPVPHNMIQRWIAEIILALEYLHDQCIVYRDLKAENVIIDENDHVKLIDFGLSVFDCNNEMKNVAGTLEYTAPEMAARSPHGRSIDYYGLGVLLYTIKAGRLPLSFKASGLDKKQYLKYIASTFRLPSTNDPLYDDLLAHLCDRDQESRWGLTAETRALLRDHQFFEGINWANLEMEIRSTKQYSPLVKIQDVPLENSMPLSLFIKSGEVLKQTVKK